MFIGEFGCCIPIIYAYLRKKSKKASAAKYSILTQDDAADDGTSDVDEVVEAEVPNALSGTRMLWMWFPAFFDSQSTS
jgi:cbb3-type cytochrome oxidase subunit 3